jgi:hypothetical protein
MMALSYTGLALCNLAEAVPEFHASAQSETAWLLRALRTRTISGFMEPHFGDPFPPDGRVRRTAVFLHGHFLYLAVRCREVFGPGDLDPLIGSVAAALARDFGQTRLLDSYRGMTYVSDNFPALAALRRYDALFAKQLSAGPVEGAIEELRSFYLHPESGLVATYVDRNDRTILGTPRGIGVMYGLTFLPEVDEKLAREQWRCAKDAIVRELPRVIRPYAELIPQLEEIMPFCRGGGEPLQHLDLRAVVEAVRRSCRSAAGATSAWSTPSARACRSRSAAGQTSTAAHW